MVDSASVSSRVSYWARIGLVAFVMIGGGIAHWTFPQEFAPLVPPLLPAIPVILIAGLAQILIGAGTLWPRTRSWGGLAFALLCTAYLPLHLWDFFRDDPVFAPPVAATIRVVAQLSFIWVGLSLWRRDRL